MDADSSIQTVAMMALFQASRRRSFCASLLVLLGIFFLTAFNFLLIYGGVIVAAIVGVVAALRQRLQEIESGEEEDAKQY